MRTFVLRLVVNAAALAVTAALLPGIHIRDDRVTTLLVVALVFGLVNAVLKPVIWVLSCPLIVLTLGLFALLINGILLLVTDALAGSRFEVDGFGWAVLGGLLVGLISMVLESALDLDEEEREKRKRDETVIIFPKLKR
ncbi:MAG: phage holin family protein [Aggregatilineaceae bacterium]